jgi:hypothetical protein
MLLYTLWLQGAPNTFDLSAAATYWDGRRLKTRRPDLMRKVGEAAFCSLSNRRQHAV